MQFKEAKEFILDKLGRELPDYLRYHSIDHIRDVYIAAEDIAAAEGITGEERTLLLTATLFHDSGFTRDSKDHEQTSCGIAKEYLPAFGYSATHLDIICGMIMATKIPQEPHNLLEQVICDADLDYLGRNDFISIGNRLFDELKYFGVVKTADEWNRMQVKFLTQHHYFTQTAIKLRQVKKEENLNLIKSLLKDENN